MKKKTRLLVVLLILALGAFFLIPTFQWYFMFDDQDRADASFTNEILKFRIEEKVTLAITGLAKADQFNSELKEIRKKYQAKIKSFNKVRKYNKIELKKDLSYTDMRTTLLKIRKEKEVDQFFKRILTDYYKEYYEKRKTVKNNAIKLGLDLQGGSYAIVTINFDHPSVEENYPDGLSETRKEEMIDNAVFKIENRINKYGLSETSIQKLKDQKKIVINIPGEERPTGLRQIIETVGVLDFKLVSKEGQRILEKINLDYKLEGKTIFDSSGKKVKPEVLSQLPADTEVLFISNKDEWGVEREDLFAKVVENVSLLGKKPQIESATVQQDPTGKQEVHFTLKGDSIAKWAKVTGDNIGREIAIILDNVILQAPVVQDKIPNGKSRIMLGNTPYEELRNLALILRSGSLNVPLEISEENSVGASLGRDTIEKGMFSLLIGAILVLIFMFFYYNLGGLIANFVLIINSFLLLAGLGMFKGTLTLPGIAGIILTIGMAVDANVIIYERIKEEFRSGKTFKTAVYLGFDRAFWTIFDANITTFAAAIGLSLFGSGPIKGFAVTLCLGIFCSLFTSLFVTRLILDTLTSYVDVKSLRVFSLLRGK